VSVTPDNAGTNDTRGAAGAGTADAVAGERGPAYSIWLLPAEPAASLLASIIDDLAHQFCTPPFLPHVTVQGDLHARLHAVTNVAADLAMAFPEQRWAIRGVEMSDIYWRSFYIALESGPTFAAALERAAAATGTRQGLSPFAHLSLGYGPLNNARKQLLQSDVTPRLPATLTFDRLVVALAGGTVGIPSWRPLQTFALG
jgi:hypothetical protein